MTRLMGSLTHPSEFLYEGFMNAAWTKEDPINTAAKLDERYFGPAAWSLLGLGAQVLYNETNVDAIPYLGAAVYYGGKGALSYGILRGLWKHHVTTGNNEMFIKDRTLHSYGSFINWEKRHISSRARLDLETLKVESDPYKLKLTDGNGETIDITDDHMLQNKRKKALVRALREISTKFQQNPEAKNMQDIHAVSDFTPAE